MIDEKPWWESRTIWASIVAVLAVAAGYFRFEIVAEDQAGLVDAITSIIGAVAGVIAIYTRAKATTALTVTKP